MYDPVWDEIFRGRAWGRYPAEDAVRFVVREAARANDRGALRALELGCGPGANLWLLANEGIAFDAIDGSPTAIAQARARLDREQPGWRGRVVSGNFCALPDDFRDYDLVLDSEAVYCNDFDESAKVVREVHRRLRPGGAFWSRTFAPGTWGVETGRRIGRDYWIAADGPMLGKGPVRLTPRGDIPELYGADWASIEVGEITRHDGDPARQIREWILVARKKA